MISCFQNLEVCLPLKIGSNPENNTNNSNNKHESDGIDEYN